ncbi:hypothetical protein [Nannocystis pusilla]|uniref:hypothetical protein n=1 Tax=Nannocystis pusilla TaxID=889268 RepID=UPI001CCEA337|nr:hypothetical protein [Nannocystis pusilla]
MSLIADRLVSPFNGVLDRFIVSASGGDGPSLEVWFRRFVFMLIEILTNEHSTALHDDTAGRIWHAASALDTAETMERDHPRGSWRSRSAPGEPSAGLGLRRVRQRRVPDRCAPDCPRLHASPSLRVMVKTRLIDRPPGVRLS